jgi:hypothetical protein
MLLVWDQKKFSDIHLLYNKFNFNLYFWLGLDMLLVWDKKIIQIYILKIINVWGDGIQNVIVTFGTSQGFFLNNYLFLFRHVVDEVGDFLLVVQC